jgi:hypothetical protein
MHASDEELWNILRNLVAARSGVPVSSNATLGDIIDAFKSQGHPLLLQHVLRPCILLPPEPTMPRPRIESMILAEEPWTVRQIQRLRWFYVCQALDQGERREDDGAYEYAANILRGSPAEGGVDSIKKAYDAMQRELPAAQQRPRTWRRRAVG